MTEVKNITGVVQERINMINGQRKAVKKIAADVLDLKQFLLSETEVTKQRVDDEVIANLMIAYRHLEDASMRLGKAIQYTDGGISVYDKETTVGT